MRLDLRLQRYLLIAAAALILALVFALQLSRSIAGPIRRLMQTMRRVEDGDLHVRSQVSSRTELGQLSDSFDHMIAKTAELMDERLRSEEQKRKSEWKALQAPGCKMSFGSRQSSVCGSRSIS